MTSREYCKSLLYAEWLVIKEASIRIMFGDAELLHDAFPAIFK